MAEQCGVNCCWVLMHDDDDEARLEAAAHALEPSAETERRGAHLKGFLEGFFRGFALEPCCVSDVFVPHVDGCARSQGMAGLGGKGT